MDQWRYSEEYHHTARWHAVGVKDGKLIPGELVGDISIFRAPLTDDEHGVARMEQMLEALEDYRNLPDSTVAVNLKCIIHMVGDLHCPGHTFFADHSQQYHFTIGGKKIHFHTFVDRAFIRYNKGVSAEEFYDGYCHLSKAEIRALCKRSVADWIWDNESDFRECYKILPSMCEYNDLSEGERRRLKEITDRLHRDAGYRLAHIVNEVFNFLTFCVSVCWARIFDNGQIKALCESADKPFIRIQKRAYLIKPFSVHVRNGRKTRDSALKYLRHKKSFYRIIKVMPERYFIASEAQSFVVEHPPSHFSAE
jgi:hypothetical protein